MNDGKNQLVVERMSDDSGDNISTGLGGRRN
jgi:hypothetical protein